MRYEEALTMDHLSVFESMEKVNGVYPCILRNNTTGDIHYYSTETAYTDACRDMFDILVEERYR